MILIKYLFQYIAPIKYYEILFYLHGFLAQYLHDYL